MGLGFGIPPAAQVRVRPHYQELPVPGPRRDIGWVWDWVLGLGNISRILENVADLDFQSFQDIRKSQKSNFQYFQDTRTPENQISNISRMDTKTPENQISNISRSPEIQKNYGFPHFRDSGECWRLQFPIFPGFWIMLQTSWTK